MRWTLAGYSHLIFKAVLAGAVGGLLWLDRFQALQIMVSRPIVCAPLVGFVLEDLAAGLATGILFEMLWLGRPPVGGYIPPDSSLAASAAAAAAAIARAETGAPLAAITLLSFLILLPVAQLGRKLDHLLRTWLGCLAAGAELELRTSLRPSLGKHFAIALVLGFLVAFAALAPIALAGGIVLIWLSDLLPPSVNRALGIAFFAVPLVAAAEVLARTQRTGDLAHFLIGFGATVGAALLLGLVT